MRITAEQVSVLHTVLKNTFANNNYELYLYGSRTRDDLKGGDIDLVILTDRIGIENFEKNKLDVLVQIKKDKLIGQRRIDLKAYLHSELKTHPFLKSISDSWVKLPRL